MGSAQSLDDGKEHELILIDEQEQIFGDIRITARAMMYSHCSRKDGSRVNQSRAMVKIVKGDVSTELSLDRMSDEAVKFVNVADLGVALALVMSDPYRSPSTATIKAKAV
jgi:hypothetical protein